MISLTSHSGSLSNSLGGGSRKFSSYLSQYVMSSIFCMIGKGLYLFGASFVDLYGSGRFVCSSQSESLSLKGLKLVSLTRHRCNVLIASWASWWWCCISLICSSRLGNCVVLQGCWIVGVYCKVTTAASLGNKLCEWHQSHI
jgi:hypothetical protein